MRDRTVHMETLENGLQLLCEVIPGSQSASLGFFVRTGARDETAKESGISHFLEHMMFKGTASRSALDITYHLGNLGAQSNAFTSEEMTVYYGSVVAEYFPRFHELLADMLRPALDQHEFDTEKKVILEEIALYQDRPHFFLYEHAIADFFGTHPAGKSVLGTVASVGAIQRDEMRDYFTRRYSPTNMVVVASGAVDWPKFVADTKRYCGGWEKFPVERAWHELKTTPASKVYKKKDLQQSHVILLAPGASVQAEERYPLALLSVILGDSSGSKLYWELVHNGLAESAGADHDERDDSGYFLASASTEPERLDDVVGVLKKVLAHPMNFTNGELEQAKRKLKTRIVLGGELPMGRMMALGQEWLYRKRVNSLSETMARVQAVTRADIEAALDRYPMKDWSEYRLIPE